VIGSVQPVGAEIDVETLGNAELLRQREIEIKEACAGKEGLRQIAERSRQGILQNDAAGAGLSKQSAARNQRGCELGGARVGNLSETTELAGAAAIELQTSRVLRQRSGHIRCVAGGGLDEGRNRRGHSEGRARCKGQDAAQLPTARRSIHQTIGVLQHGFAAAERQLVDAVALEDVGAAEVLDALICAAVLRVAIVVVVVLRAAELVFADVALHSNPGQPVIDSKIFSCF